MVQLKILDKHSFDKNSGNSLRLFIKVSPVSKFFNLYFVNCDDDVANSSLNSFELCERAFHIGREIKKKYEKFS